jgi:hypothetical protein
VSKVFLGNFRVYELRTDKNRKLDKLRTKWLFLLIIIHEDKRSYLAVASISMIEATPSKFFLIILQDKSTFFSPPPKYLRKSIKKLQ